MNQLKAIVLKSILALIIANTPSIALAGKWYANGNLHKVTVSQWNVAKYDNKLATAADWVITNSSMRAQATSRGLVNFSVLKLFASQLVICVDEASAGSGYENVKIVTIVVGCMTLMGW